MRLFCVCVPLRCSPFMVCARPLCGRLYGKYVKRLSKEARKKLADATCVAEEAVSNIRTGAYVCGRVAVQILTARSGCECCVAVHRSGCDIAV